MRSHDTASGAVFFCCGLFIAIYSVRFEIGSLRVPGSGFMPFLSGLLICAFSSVTFLRALFNKSAEVKQIWAEVKFQKLIFAILTLIGYAILLKTLGFIICSFFLILIYFRVMGSHSWLRSVLGASLISFSSYLLFETWLKAQLPMGILWF